MPSFITVSIASGVPTPFHQREDRFVDHRHQDAVGDEPGIVGGFDRGLAQLHAQLAAVSIDSADVACPRINSTSVISGTGFMKCIPSTCRAAWSRRQAW